MYKLKRIRISQKSIYMLMDNIYKYDYIKLYNGIYKSRILF